MSSIDNNDPVEKARGEAMYQKVKADLAELEVRAALVKAMVKELIELREYKKSQEGKTMEAQELQKLIDYHREHIEPCRKALEGASTVIFQWADALTDAKIDCLPLYEYLAKTLKVIDPYIETEHLT